MSYTIYTNADVGMMESLFSAIAAWSSSGGVVSLGPTAGSAVVPYQLFVVGLAIGIITAMIQSMMRGGDKIEIGPVMVSMVLFLVMFVPKTTVLVQSNQTGEMRAVANVPVGAAIPGWFFSSVGQHFASETETLFGMPSGTGVTDQGFGQTLQMYAELEKAQSTDRLFSVFNKVIGGSNTENIDTFASLKNYINDCTLEKIEKKGMQPGKVLGFTVDALKYNDTNESTELYLYTTGPQIKDCSAAWTDLESLVFNKFSDNAVVAVLNDIFSIPGSAAAAGETALTRASTNNAALGFNVNVQDLWSSSVLRPASLAAMAEHESQMGNTAGAMALEMNYHSGRITQETAMIGKGFAWRDMMLHLMTFAEVVFYGVLPMMALFIAAGALGLKTFSKFMVLGIWIQMWTPMLALVDFYIDFQAKDMMQAVADTLDGSGSLSISQLAEAADVTQKALATGYSFMPMIPILSLFILTGSMMAATRVFDGGGQAAGAMGAAAALSPKNEAFGASRQADGSYINKDWQRSASEGYRAYSDQGSASGSSYAGVQLPDFTLSSNFAQARENAAQRTSEASESLTGAIQTGYTTAQQMGNTSKLDESFGESLTSAQGESYAWARSLKSDLMNTHGMSDDVAEQIVGKIGAGFKVAGTGSDLTAGYTGTDKESVEDRISKAESEAAESKEDANYRADLGAKFGETYSAVYSDTEAASQGQTITENAAEVSKAAESEKDVQTAASRMDTDRSIAVGEVMSSPALMEKLRELESGLTPDQREDYEARKADFNSVLSEKANPEDPASEKAVDIASRMSALNEVDSVGFGNAFLSAGFGEGHGSDDSLTVPDEGSIASPDEKAPDANKPVTNTLEEQRPAMRESFDENGATVRQDYDNNQSELQEEAERSVHLDNATQIASQIADRQSVMSESDTARQLTEGGTPQSLLDNASNYVTSAVEAGGDVFSNVAEAFNSDESFFGGLLEASSVMFDATLGDGFSDAVRQSQGANIEELANNIHDNLYNSEEAQALPDDQRQLYANYGTAHALSAMAATQDAIQENLEAFSLPNSPVAQLAESGLFESHEEIAQQQQQYYGAAGLNAADVQKEINTHGTGVRAGEAIVKELRIAATHQDTPDRVVDYNQSMEQVLPQQTPPPRNPN